MARSAEQDPVEKFRFEITVFSLDLSVSGGLSSLASELAGEGGIVGDVARKLGTISRAGFSEVTLPKATINEMPYRENIDNQRFSKIPGLVKFEPVVLKRGVTKSRDLYNWYRLVNDDINLLVAAQELAQGSTQTTPQNETYRKEVAISVLDRKGNVVKRWLLFNAWPMTYKGGDDLNSQSEEKLIEEITLNYETFIELGGVGSLGEALLKESVLSALEVAANSAANRAIKSITPPFLR